METMPQVENSVSRRSVLGAFLAAGATVLAGCTFGGGSSGSHPSGTGSSAKKQLTLAVPADVTSLDPHYINNGGYIVPCGLLEGLVAFDATGKGVVPAIADKWTVSSDGLTYTFHIRPNAKYSNGDPISAKDFEWCYKRLFSPTATSGSGSTLGANSYHPDLGIKGAVDYMAGTNTDWSTVGVSATNSSTLVITLQAPNSAFLMGMTDRSMLLLNPTAVKKSPTAWMQPSNWVGSGPYMLTAWQPTTGVTMRAHEHYWDSSNIHIDQITAKVISNPNSMLLAYRNNELDVCPITTSGVTIGKDRTLLSQEAQAPGYEVQYLQNMYSKHPASQDARVRRALAMAIDRDAVAKVVPGSQPGTSLVPSAVPGWDQSLAIKYDPDQAKSLLAAAGYPGGKGMPTVQVLASMEQPEIDAVLNMWEASLGIKTKYNVVDASVYATQRSVPIVDPNLWGFYAGGYGGIPTFGTWLIYHWGPSVIPVASLSAAQATQYLSVQASKSLSTSAKLAKLAAITDQHATPEAKKYARDAAAAAAMNDRAAQTKAWIAVALQLQALAYQIPVLWEPMAFLVKPAVHGLHVQYSIQGFYFKGMSLAK